jgi:hypothetical protein
MLLLLLLLQYYNMVRPGSRREKKREPRGKGVRDKGKGGGGEEMHLQKGSVPIRKGMIVPCANWARRGRIITTEEGSGEVENGNLPCCSGWWQEFARFLRNFLLLEISHKKPRRFLEDETS